MAMTGTEIRQSFIQFFKSKGHKHVRSSSLVPHNDPTILFTNAGMNQFKDYFLGNQKPEFNRAVTSQKVMRAGGKHNDLENVGRTDRHHTFFEMLGNFSFGDYFKKEAIAFAWEYLTDVLELEPDRLVVSVFEDDQESFDIWHKDIGIPKERIGRLGEKENFWSMGDTGPCGPCSEIHYQLQPMTEGYTVQKSLEADDGTFLEIWNLVFMQFNKEDDGAITPLPKPSIDTGMGIERIATVVQHFKSNYESDLLSGLVSKVLSEAPNASTSEGENIVAARVIADHIRATVFLIADGVIPANEGRGYVLKRIIRRAARHGKELGYKPGFFAALVDYFVPTMSDAYPEIKESQGYIKILIEQEERRFSSTLNQGMKILDDLLDEQRQKGGKEIKGEEIFKLYDTYGFPVDLADDILQDHGLTFNRAAFEMAMTEQRNRAKSAQDSRKIDLKVNAVYLDLIENGLGNHYLGYQNSEIQTKISAIIRNGQLSDTLSKDDKLEIVLAESPFYAESGGQVGDRGEIFHSEFRILVYDTQSPLAGLNIAYGKVVSATAPEIDISKNRAVTAKASLNRHQQIECNHTATHLLQAGLRTVLGDHVKQAGSLVNDEKLRFDFSHYAPVSREQLLDVETFINQCVIKNTEVVAQEMSFDEAIKTGAMAIFGEKYGDKVRVVTAGSASKELCGGTHTSRLGNIGFVKIISEESIAAGIRRIEALTGEKALEYVQQNVGLLDNIAQKFKVPQADVAERVEQLISQLKEKEKLIDQLQNAVQAAAASEALTHAKMIGDIRTLIMKVSSDVELKSQAVALQKAMGSGLIMLAKTLDADKISVVIVTSKDLNPRLQAGQLVKELGPIISAKGGGSPTIAQCGGSDPSAWPKLVAELEKRVAV
ncbi:MAG: alanine--tRNA ligase [SAR324 cluster bacterium]|nr:alanine--tRNA ligase [SAR324 cluster bacterium]